MDHPDFIYVALWSKTVKYHTWYCYFVLEILNIVTSKCSEKVYVCKVAAVEPIADIFDYTVYIIYAFLS